MLADTRDSTQDDGPSCQGNVPGVVVVFSATEPVIVPVPFNRGRIVLGRGLQHLTSLHDDRLSRQHAEIHVDGGRWTVRDLASRNGTFVDGVQVQGMIETDRLRVLRLGDTILVPATDVSRLRRTRVDADIVVGPALHEVLACVDRAARTEDSLLIRGESGTGKELAARRCHASSRYSGGPFVALNCAAIPRELAERLLFGAKRGSYTGAAADAVGHMEMANRGLLFLDEVGELALDVQAKLLRVLETREVLPLGASTPRRVELQVCCATHRDLRAHVAAGTFRKDLYHRLVPPEVVLPPLRERIEEIPLHMTASVRGASPTLGMQARLVERCMLRPWPGNVRELRKETYHAAVRAVDEGADRVRIDDLGPTAGLPIETPAVLPAAGDAERAYVRWGEALTADQIERALEESGGSVAVAARRLGMQRTQLYREMKRWSIERRRDA